MPSLAEKPRVRRKQNKPGKRKRPPKRKKPVVHRLKYWSPEAAWVEHEKIRVHPMALKLRELNDQEFAALRGKIIREDGTVNLSTPIEIMPRGSILEGRHRARILVEAGHGDELARQIQARSGRWIKQLPDDVDPALHVALTQLGRRNCGKQEVALMLLPKYREAAAEGNAEKGKRGREPGVKSPVEAFCEMVQISKTTFHELDWLDRHASRAQMKELRASRITRRELRRELESTRKTGSNISAVEDARCDKSAASQRKTPARSGANQGTESTKLQQSSSPTTAKSRSFEVACRPAVKLLDRLLSGVPDDVADAHADVLLASLNEAALQRIVRRVRQLDL